MPLIPFVLDAWLHMKSSVLAFSAVRLVSWKSISLLCATLLLSFAVFAHSVYPAGMEVPSVLKQTKPAQVCQWICFLCHRTWHEQGSRLPLSKWLLARAHLNAKWNCRKKQHLFIRGNKCWANRCTFRLRADRSVSLLACHFCANASEVSVLHIISYLSLPSLATFSLFQMQ